MKKTVFLSVFSILLLSFIACDSNEPTGAWSDTIKLSKKEVSVTAQSNQIVITTRANSWWFNEVVLSGKPSVDLSGIDTKAANFRINATDFSIERKNATEIHISMKKNETGSERVLHIGIQSGNYVDAIKVKQSAN